MEIPYWAPVLTALAGGSLVGIFNFIKDWQNRKSEERRHFREVMLNTALEHWKQSSQVWLEMGNRGKKVSLLPIESNIIYLMKLSEVLMDNKITKDNILDKLKEVREVTLKVEEYFTAEKSSGEIGDKLPTK